MSFPLNPTDQQKYTDGTITYVYTASLDSWSILFQVPVNPVAYQQYIDTTGKVYQYINKSWVLMYTIV